jgi:hypothetical protein
MYDSIQFSKVYNNARLTTKELISIGVTFLEHPVLHGHAHVGVTKEYYTISSPTWR